MPQYLAGAGAADDGSADDDGAAASPWACAGALEDRSDFNGFAYDALATDEPQNSVAAQRERAAVVDYYGASVTRMTDWGFYEVLNHGTTPNGI